MGGGLRKPSMGRFWLQNRFVGLPLGVSVSLLVALVSVELRSLGLGSWPSPLVDLLGLGS